MLIIVLITGRLTAARSWQTDAETLVLPPAAADSYETLLHDAMPNGMPGYYLLFRSNNPEVEVSEPLVEALSETPRPVRSIGVLFDPEDRRSDNYMQALLPSQFDGVVFFDK